MGYITPAVLHNKGRGSLCISTRSALSDWLETPERGCADDAVMKSQSIYEQSLLYFGTGNGKCLLSDTLPLQISSMWFLFSKLSTLYARGQQSEPCRVKVDLMSSLLHASVIARDCPQATQLIWGKLDDQVALKASGGRKNSERNISTIMNKRASVYKAIKIILITEAPLPV